MSDPYPSLSTDQVAAFIELSRHGSIRRAAELLLVTEQGLRNRLIVLERRLGVELYRKTRGPRQGSILTHEGQRFLPMAQAFLEHAQQLTELHNTSAREQEVHVAASGYLTRYLLIDAIRRFRSVQPSIRIRVSTRPEREIEAQLLEDPKLSIGIAAPYESPRSLSFERLFGLEWSLIAPRRHAVLRMRSVRLASLAKEPLILFEPGSTGRQHVMEAFHAQGLSPHVEMETTSTETIVRMVEAGFGISIVPLMPDGRVTRGARVGVRPVNGQVQAIQSGVLSRRDEPIPRPALQFVEFLQQNVQGIVS